jgi:hypothetical protein
MATLTTQEIRRTGAAITPVAAAGGGDSFTPGADTFLLVVNGSGGAITVTVATPREAFPDVAVADVAVSVPAGTTRYIGPFPAEHFAQADDGLADITYSGATSVTVAAVRLKQP